ncbi:hypothetical protein DL766_007731 [Monosporascus sp. MC13-8B]|uniref:Uncharacterized protein n=1 Tax=Monosporascus cannonballus TaxID=155416 RepID=A0ABY0HFI6_9PEZI|nr:hypothetical protein DL763_010870 [Monosporascus cannonballus]RYO89353.1 hypothetical protein DL762_003244 [Monosporascus cannonballus]RYP22413.1 hypothetical protein DL766_007731 [Monosporascus sp. MC13-8B]
MKAHLRRKYSDICAAAENIEDYIKSLDTDIQDKYVDVDTDGNVGEDSHDLNRRGEPTSLSSILHRPVNAALTYSQQIRLAASLVKGVLQYHSTPWLPDYWRLEDLSFFDTEDDLVDSLRTLHITNELSSSSLPKVQTDAVMRDAAAQLPTPPSTRPSISPSLVPGQAQDGDDGDEDEALHAAMLWHGIRNLPLHSPGVALLQIGRWDPTLDPNDIVRVRELSEGTLLLGKRYKRLV